MASQETPKTPKELFAEAKNKLGVDGKQLAKILTNSSAKGYTYHASDLSSLNTGNSPVKAGKKAEALSLYKQIIEHPEQFRDLAKQAKTIAVASTSTSEEQLYQPDSIKAMTGEYKCQYYDARLDKVQVADLRINQKKSPSGSGEIQDCEPGYAEYARLESGKRRLYTGTIRVYDQNFSLQLTHKNSQIVIRFKVIHDNPNDAIYEGFCLGIDQIAGRPMAYRVFIMQTDSFHRDDRKKQLVNILKFESHSLTALSRYGVFDPYTGYLKSWEAGHEKYNAILRKVLDGRMFLSYNMFDKVHDEIFTRAWWFRWSDGRLLVERAGTKGSLSRGECYMIASGKACIKLIPDDAAGEWWKKERYYMFELKSETKDIKSLELLGLGLNRKDSILGGKELLLLQKTEVNQYKAEAIWEGLKESCGSTELMNNDELDALVVSHLVSNETSVLGINQITERLEDDFIKASFYVFYINGNGKLVRNKAYIQEYSHGIFFDYKGVRRQYKTIHSYFHEQTYFFALKDNQSKNYFCMNLKSVQANKDGRMVLSGTSSAISSNSQLPVAQATLFLQSSEDFIDMECLEFEPGAEMPETEQLVDAYLKMKMANPIAVRPFRHDNLSEEVEGLKQQLIDAVEGIALSFFKPAIQDNPYKDLIRELTQLLRLLKDKTRVDITSSFRSTYRLFFAAYLKALKKGDFVKSTSYLSDSYFWLQHKVEGSVEAHIEAFIKAGGRMARIFILDRHIKELTVSQASILATHYELYGKSDKEEEGVFVLTRTSVENKIPEDHLNQTFLIDSRFKSNWEISSGMGENIKGMSVGFEDGVYQIFHDRFNQLQGFAHRLGPEHFETIKRQIEVGNKPGIPKGPAEEYDPS